MKILLDVAKESSDWFPPLKSALGGVNALIKHYEVRVEGIVVAHNSHRPSQHSKNVKEKVEDLIIQLDSFKQNITTAVVDGDPEETNRRRGLIEYVYTLMTTLTIPNGGRSAFGRIEELSQKLLAKGAVARFVDKEEDSKTASRVIERFREAVMCYQVS